MPLFGMCANSERPVGSGPVTEMAKAAGSWTAREAEAIIVMLCWHPRIYSSFGFVTETAGCIPGQMLKMGRVRLAFALRSY